VPAAVARDLAPPRLGELEDLRVALLAIAPVGARRAAA
jgi:hypothetical protein